MTETKKNKQLRIEVKRSELIITELLTLLDRIEIQDDAALAIQRFDIAKKHGLTVVITGEASRETH